MSREEGGELVGEVLWVDRFGNAQLNVGPEEVDGWGDQIQLRFGDTVRTGSSWAPTAGSAAASGWWSTRRFLASLITHEQQLQ